MAKIIHNLSLADIAPPSIKTDDTVKNIIAAIDPELLNVSDAISEAFIISRLDSLPEPVLDLLAWQWHVDFYELAHNIDAKREMVKSSIEWHRHKGTRYAIVKALEMLGVEARFEAWHENEDTKDQPYTFTVEAKLTGDFWERVDWTKTTQTIRRAIIESKATRSYISRLYIYFEDSTIQNINVGLGGFVGYHYTIKPDIKPNDGIVKMNLAVATAVCSGIHQVIRWKYNTQTKVMLNTSTVLAAVQGINVTATMKEA